MCSRGLSSGRGLFLQCTQQGLPCRAVLLILPRLCLRLVSTWNVVTLPPLVLRGQWEAAFACDLRVLRCGDTNNQDWLQELWGQNCPWGVSSPVLRACACVPGFPGVELPGSVSSARARQWEFC